MLRLNELELKELQRRMKNKIPPGLSHDEWAKCYQKQSGNKFHNVICEADNIKFRSKKERKRYLELCVLRDLKECWFLMQTPFRLPGNTKYLLDFMVFWKDGKVTFEDTKGFRTDIFKLKKSQVESLYPIKITEG